MGHWVFAWVGAEETYSLQIAEAIAIRSALEIALNHNVKHVIVEGEAKRVIDALWESVYI